MANNKDFDLDGDLGDLNFDDGLDFSMDSDLPKGGPIRRASTAALDEFMGWHGIKNAAAKTAYAALPKGYQQAFDLASNIKNQVSNIYDKSVKDLNPTIQTMKKLGRRNISAAEKILPQGLAEKYKRAVEVEGGDNGAQFDPAEFAVTESLTAIFGAEQKAAENRAEVDSMERTLDRNINKKQFAANLGVQTSIASGIGRLVGYQDGVLSKYHRKSLELQHRQYFATKELVEFTKASNISMMEQMRALVYNTSLPNEIKLKHNEEWQKDSLLRTAGSSGMKMKDKLRSIPDRLAKGLEDQIGEFISSVNNSFEMIDSFMPDEGEGLDPSMMMGSMIGSTIRDSLATEMGKKLGKKLLENKDVREWNERLLYYTDNFGRYINTKIKKNDTDNKFFRFLGDILGTAGKDTETISTDLRKNATAPAQWDQLSRRSIIEIIPGYLSRILEQLTHISTGKKGVSGERIAYSVDREDFVPVREAVKDIQKKVSEEMDRDILKRAEHLLKLIDPKNTIPSKARAELILQMAQDAADGLIFDPTTYGQPEKLNISDPKAAGIAAARMRAFFGVSGGEMDRDELFQKRRRKAATSVAGLAERVGDWDEILKEYSATGDKDLLRRAKLIGKKDGKTADEVNFDLKWQMIQSQLEGKEPQFYAKGGKITPYGKTDIAPSDTVPAMLTPGEVVIPKNVVNKYGHDFFKGLIEDGDVQGFAEGGRVKPMKARARNTKHEMKVEELLNRIAEGIEGSFAFGIGGNITGSGFFNKVTELAGKGWDKLWEVQGKVAGQLGRAASYGMEKGTKLFNFASEKLGEMYQSAKDRATDIYIMGSDKIPIIKKQLLESGFYKDKNGKPLWTLEDIRNAKPNKQGVILFDADGEPVLWANDVHKLYEKTKGKISMLFEGGSKMLGRFIQFQGSIIETGIDIIKTAGKQVTDYMKGPYDVYVGEETTPRLRKIGFSSGWYLSAKDKRRKIVINHPDEIDGPIMDRDKNILISAEDITQGLFDAWGNPVDGTGLVGRVMNTAKRSFGKAIEMAGNIARNARDIGSNMLGGLFGGSGGLGFGSRNMVVYQLEKIYRYMRVAFPNDLDESIMMQDWDKATPGKESKLRAKLRMIQERGAIKKEEFKGRISEKVEKVKDKFKDKIGFDLDGDGIREGSFMDQMRKNKEKLKGKAGELAEKIPGREKVKEKLTAGKDFLKEKGGGILSTITGLFTGKGGGRSLGAAVSESASELNFIKGLAMAWLAEKMASSVFGGVGGKLMGGLKGLGGKAMGAMRGVAGAGRMAFSIGSMLMGGGSAAAGVGGVVSAGGAGVAAAGAGTAATAAGGAGAAGTAAALLSNPVGWAVLGAAAIYASYKLAKYLARRAPLEPLEKLRYLQYGINITNKHQVAMIRYLEDELADDVELTDKGRLIFEHDWKDLWEEYHGDFGAEEENPIHIENARRWFYSRFLPVLAFHKLAAKKIDDGIDILDIDDEMDAEDKYQFVTRVQFGAKEREHLKLDPYNVMVSPFPDIPLAENRALIEKLSEHIKSTAKRGENADDDKNIKGIDEVDKQAKLNNSPAYRLGQKLKEKREAEAKRAQKGGMDLGLDPMKDLSGKDRYTPENYVQPVAIQKAAGMGGSVGDLQSVVFNALIGSNMTKEEMSLFLANVSHESGGFRRLKENLNYKPERLLEIFKGRNGINTIEDARRIVAQGPDAIAEAVYGGEWGARKLGNIKPGDGAKYIGRGFIQLTGRSNYEMASKALGIDLVNNPDLASDPEIAAKIALWKWRQSGASKLAASGDAEGARRAINGGLIGFDETQKLAAGFSKNLTAASASASPLPPSNPAKAIAAATTPDGKKPISDAKVASAAASTPSVVTPTVNVAAPDLNPINETNVELAKGAAGQRDNMATLMQSQNEILSKILETQTQLAKVDSSGNKATMAKSAGGPTNVDLPVNVSKTA